MNGAEVIAEILKAEGTEFLSCYPRNQVIEPCAAIDIRPILCRQERVGVGIADGYSRIKRGKRNGVNSACFRWLCPLQFTSRKLRDAEDALGPGHPSGNI